MCLLGLLGNDNIWGNILRSVRPMWAVVLRRGGPSKSTVQRLVAKFETTGSVNNQPTPARQRNARSAGNIAAVRESVQENPRKSIPCRAQELGLSQTSTWRILRRDLTTVKSETADTEERKSVKRKNEESESDDESGRDTPPPKPSKKLKKATKSAASTKPRAKKIAEKATPATKNVTTTSYSDIDLSCDKKNALGQTWNFIISSWNVDGIRAWIKKGGLNYIDEEKPDVFCLQETKCSEAKLPDEARDVEGYTSYWCSSDKEGYAGVGLYSRTKPLSVTYGLDVEEHDNEGRLITAEFDKFYVLSVYVPNSGRGLVTLPKRLRWNAAFQSYVAALDKKKPVVICGDMNVSHLDIDLTNPKTNTKNAGFTREERDGMTDLLSAGYVDTFRQLYPDVTGVYTFWTYMANCRAKNVGWRLDYFIVSRRLVDSVCDSVVRNKIFGSDHCPITLFLAV